MEIGKKLKMLRDKSGKSQSEICSALNIEQGTLSNYENGSRMPRIEILVKLATYYDVPTDYLLGIGIFEDWNTIVEQKDEILKIMSGMLSRISSDILNGIDDITFCKLVYAFNVKITKHSDGTFGISAKDPFPTYPSNVKNISALHEPNENNLLCIYRELSTEDRTILYGKALDLRRTSVAAGSSEKKASGK